MFKDITGPEALVHKGQRLVIARFNAKGKSVIPFIESSMLTIYKTSKLYQEIQRGNWKEEGEIEKLAELKALIERCGSMNCSGV